MAEDRHSAEEKGEYDYEGDMAKSQLKSIITNAQRMHDMLEETTNLPEWVQSKITLAEDYILTATSYMEGEMSEEYSLQERINIVKAKMGDVIKDFYKSDAPQFAGRSKSKRRQMAIAAKLGAMRKSKMSEELKGNQHKIDANKNNKIDAQDFKMLRSKLKMKKEEVEPIQESYTLYHNSYTDAVNHAFAHHAKSGLKSSDDDRMQHVGLGSKKPGEGKTTTVNIPATHEKTGKKHMIHIQVYNKGGSKPYELNTYSSTTRSMQKESEQNEEVEQVDERNKENKVKKNAYVSSIIQNKLHPSVLPSLKYGRQELKKEEVEIDEGRVKAVNKYKKRMYQAAQSATKVTPQGNAAWTRAAAIRMTRDKMKKEEVENVDEASYSAKAARAGKDIGKPGKMFSKIAASAAKRYGSEERGKKVAGAVLAKLRAKEKAKM